MEKRVFKIKCYVNNNQENTRLIKDIEKEEYSIELGRKDANKDAVAFFNELLEKVTKQIRNEYQDNNIDVILY